MRVLSNMNNLKVVSRNQKGFTLVELLVVIGILGILMVGTLIALDPVGRFNSAKDANAKGAVDQISSALQAYYATNNQTYPANLTALVTSGDLKSVPTGPDGVTDIQYKSSATPNAAVYFMLLKTSPGFTVWCYQTTTGKAQAVANVAACDYP